MSKYRVYNIANASWVVGEYEAHSEKEALDMADEDNESNWSVSICYHCAHEVEISDPYKTEVENMTLNEESD